MFSKPLVLLVACLALALAIVACGSDSTPTNTPIPPTETPEPAAQSTYAPVTVEGCTAVQDEEGELQLGSAAYTYTEPPSRAITMNQHVTEVMLALELQDHMVGTAYIDDEILPEYQAAYGSVPVLAEEYPSKEVIMAQDPDFIYGGFRSPSATPPQVPRKSSTGWASAPT